MVDQEAASIKLDIFRGPLSFLLRLVQRSEIDICELYIKEITEQFLADIAKLASFEHGVDFIGKAALLLFLKSRSLIPQEELPLDEEEESALFYFRQILDYCRIKEQAASLQKRLQRQRDGFFRGVPVQKDRKRGLGLEKVTIEDLAACFQDIVGRAKERGGRIYEESFRVADKIPEIRDLVRKRGRVSFSALFTPEKPREELIVTFLAILEMMKSEEVLALKEKETDQIFIVARDGQE